MDTRDLTGKEPLLTMADYESLLAYRYRSAGISEAMSLHFAHGEINAIQTGNHWTYGKLTAPDPQQLIFSALSDADLEKLIERATILEFDGGMCRADAETRAFIEIISKKYPVPQEKPRSAYQGFAAIKHTVSAGIGIKEFFAKSGDNDPTAYTTDPEKIATMWNEGQRRFKAFIRGSFLAVDIDRKPGKPDGLEAFYRIFPRETLPAELQNLPESFPVYTATPSGGFHLFFKYIGPELKLRELASGVEIKEWQITAPGSRRENTGEYILHGELNSAPPLYGLLIDAIEEAKQKKEQAKAERSRHRAKAPEELPSRLEKHNLSGFEKMEEYSRQST